jgi:hypothetical protein
MRALLTVLRYTERAIMLPFSSAHINYRGAWVQSGRGMPLAQHGGCDHTTCAATGCNNQESQLHLVECPIINR